MTIDISDNNPRASYTVAQGVVQTTFTVPFEFFEDADVSVYLDDVLKTQGSHYTLSASTVTMSVTGATGGSSVVLVRSVALERTTDFVAGQDINRASLNQQLDTIVAQVSDLKDKADRTVHLSNSEVAPSMLLTSDRKGKVMAFNATTGAVEAGPTISDVQSVANAAADIQTLAHIEDGTDATDVIQTVAGISANVTTVGGIAANVTTVAGNTSNINTVAGNNANVTTVAGISADVTAVAGKAALITTDFVSDLNALAVTDVISDINLLATSDIVSDLNALATSDIISDLNTLATSDIVSDINTLATNDIVGDLNLLATSDFVADLNLMATAAAVADLSTVADNDANITTVAGISSDVTTVSGISSAVTTVAADGTDIGVVAGISSNVSTVSGVSGNVTTVAGISGNVTTVAGISANVTAVAGDAADIGTVATDLAGSDNIGTVAGSISNVNTVGGSISNVNTVAGINANVTTVAGISSDVSTVAADGTDIGVVSGISSDVSTVSGISGNVTTVAGISSNVSSVAGIAANVTSVAGDEADIGVVAGDLAGSDTIGTVAGAISNVNTVSGSIASVNTVASNLTTVNDFAARYRSGATDPTSNNDEGDLFYNTTSDSLKVYTGSAWEQGVTAGSGFLPLTGGGLTGNLTFSSTQTVDGRDLSVDGTKLDGIESGATADQTKADIDALNINADLLDGQQGSYYTGYTDTAVSNLVDSSPAALNTLNELAAALGDDANFATTTATSLGEKLPKAGGAMTGAITTNSTFDGRNVSVDGAKLDGIEAGANVTDTANVVAALTAGSNITIAANGTIAGAAQYTHPTHAGDDASVDTGALSGATVISDLDFNITTDTLGHVTDANATVATRNLTLANLGYTGATNANYITNNNQLSNGAGYTTSVGDITGVTAGTNLTGGGSSGGVTVNLTASPNITSLSVGSSEVISSGRQLKNIASIDATTATAIGAAGVGGGYDPVTVTGNAPSLNVGNNNFFDQTAGLVNGDTTVSFTNVPTNAYWQYSFVPKVASSYSFTLGNVALLNQDSTNISQPYGLFVKQDGLRIYSCDDSSDTIKQLNYAKAWDFTSSSVLRQTTGMGFQPAGIFFKPDGLTFYTMNYNGSVRQYTLSTAWDIQSSRTQVYTTSVSGRYGKDLWFNNTGTRMFVFGETHGVSQFSLSSAWNVNSASFVRSKKFSSPRTVDLWGGALSQDGTKLYTIGRDGPQKVERFNLSTAWNISTASFVDSFSHQGGAISGGMDLSDDGSRYTTISLSYGGSMKTWVAGPVASATFPSSITNPASLPSTELNGLYTIDFQTNNGGTDVQIIGVSET